MAWGVEMAWDCVGWISWRVVGGFVGMEGVELPVLGKRCSCGCEGPGEEGKMGRKGGAYVWSCCCSCRRHIS